MQKDTRTKTRIDYSINHATTTKAMTLLVRGLKIIGKVIIVLGLFGFLAFCINLSSTISNEQEYARAFLQQERAYFRSEFVHAAASQDDRSWKSLQHYYQRKNVQMIRQELIRLNRAIERLDE